MKKRLQRGISLVLSSMLVLQLSATAIAAEYVVVSGDNLSKIAVTYDTTWWDLAAYNNLANPHLIYPGDIIQIPADESVEAEVEVPVVPEVVTPEASSDETIYVDVDATGLDDGTSWANAYTDLQDALGASVAGDEIWVAEGTYYPSDIDDISRYFEMQDDVAVYGGFAGVEETLDQRDYENNVTILSGDIGVKDDFNDNSVKVVVAANNIIDGFTIIGGNFESNGYSSATDLVEDGGADELGHVSTTQVAASGVVNSMHGNGINIWQKAPTIQNCIITGNSGGKGGGIYIYGRAESGEIPTIINCVISDNVARGRGGGLTLDVSATAVIIDCIFDGNSCLQGKGGAIYSDFGCSPYLDNCLFINNVAEGGGGIGNDGNSSPFISNCTMIMNTAYEDGAGLYQGTGSFNDPVIIDSIIWNNTCDQGTVSVYNWNDCNPLISYSIIDGGYDGTGNLDIDPEFLDELGNYSADSVAMTAGSDGGAVGFDASLMGTRTIEDYEAVIEYLLGLEKPVVPTPIDFTNDTTVDETAVGEVLYVNLEATGNETGATWEDALTDLQVAIDLANASYVATGNAVEIWVAQGTYYTGTQRSDSYMLRAGVSLYGGFAATETALDQRDFETNVTTLSAEIGDPTIQTDNSYHVLIGSDEALIDGFVITGGYADGVGGEIYDTKGGGLLNYSGGLRVNPGMTPTIGFDTQLANCTFVDNYALAGGAVYSYHGSNSVYENCQFINNSAVYGGAIMENAGNNTFYYDCSFVGNSSEGKGGAAMIDYGAMVSFYNTTFEDNTSGTSGGVVYLVDRASQAVPNEQPQFYLMEPEWSYPTDIFSSIYAEGCTFTNNHAGTDGSVAYIYEDSYGYFKDCIFEDNGLEEMTLVVKNEAHLIIEGGTMADGAYAEAIYADELSEIRYK